MSIFVFSMSTSFNKRLLRFAVGFLLLLCGCSFLQIGYPSAGRSVSVTFRNQPLTTGQNLSIESPAVQELLRLVDKAATAQGLKPFHSKSLPGRGNTIAQYQYYGAGREGPSSCGVELVGATVNIQFREAPVWSLSSTTMETCKAFADEVKAHFGEKVKVRIKRS